MRTSLVLANLEVQRARVRSRLELDDEAHAGQATDLSRPSQPNRRACRDNSERDRYSHLREVGRAGSQLRRPQAHGFSRDEAGASQSSRNRRQAGSFRRESCAKINGRYDLRRYALRHGLCGWDYSGAGNARSAGAGRNEGGIMVTDTPRNAH